MKPIISVVMPVHNGVRFIAQAIESVLQQTYSHWELIIIDDASSDGTDTVIRSFRDSRIRVVSHREIKGLSESRNRGVDESKGSYVAFLDSDDVARSDRLDKQIAFLENHPDISLCGSWVQIMNEKGVSTSQVWKHACHSQIIPIILLFRNCITQSSVMIRTNVLRRYRFRPRYTDAPDYDVWSRMVVCEKMVNLPIILTWYRIHANNMSKSIKKQLRTVTKNIYRNQLKSLFSPTSTDLIAHDMIEHKAYLSDEDLDSIETVLKKIKHSNDSKQRYNPTMMNEVLSQYWFRCCLNGSGQGFRRSVRYLRSPLRENQFLLQIFHRGLLSIFGWLSIRRTIDVSSHSWLRLHGLDSNI